MKQVNILWADDEIDFLKPHIIFLTEKGYQLTTCTNGTDAINYIKQTDFDLVLLDEHMPGLSGLETLTQIKLAKPDIPVVMITKNEEENLMNDAIGSKIADYLIKPVNPKQILISVKKLTEQKKLVDEKTTANYQAEFRQIGSQIQEASSFQQWVDLYNKLVYWEIELTRINDPGMLEILNAQRKEANQHFARFIKINYADWINGKAEKPQLSHTIIKEKVYPHINKEYPVFLIVIDNLRLDQWKTFAPLLNDIFKIETDELYCSILPTVTQYARNAIFSGLMPLAIRKIYPNLWESDEESDINNQFEADLLKKQLTRLGPEIKFAYEKINNLKTGKRLVDNINNYMNNQLVVLVYNFMDILSHARTDLETIRELANDEAAYRTLMLSWFQHSYLFDLFKFLSSQKCKLIITTDHGSIKVSNAVKVIGDKETTVNLRYKQGRNLNYNIREVFAVSNPESIQLPKFNISTSFVFASGEDFLTYPNNFNHYVNYYKNTFQHGGISMEEMLVPFVVLTPQGM